MTGFTTVVTKGVTMLSSRRTLLLAIFLCIFLFSGSAYAVPFTGEAWLAEHYTGGEATGEYYLVIKNTGDLGKVRLRGLRRTGNFRLKTSAATPNFLELTGIAGTGGVTYYEIRSDRGIVERFNRRARNRSRMLVQTGQLAREDRRDWMDNFVERRLMNRVFRLSFVEDGITYTKRISYASFENPPHEDTKDEGGYSNGVASVPEPSTMLLLGTGILGLAALRRRFK